VETGFPYPTVFVSILGFASEILPLTSFLIGNRKMGGSSSRQTLLHRCRQLKHRSSPAEVNQQSLGGKPLTSPWRGASTTQPLLLLWACRSAATTVQQRREVPVLPLPVQMPAPMCTAVGCTVAFSAGMAGGVMPLHIGCFPRILFVEAQHSGATYFIPSFGVL